MIIDLRTHLAEEEGFSPEDVTTRGRAPMAELVRKLETLALLPSMDVLSYLGGEVERLSFPSDPAMKIAVKRCRLLQLIG